jgi:hypothetical protein
VTDSGNGAAVQALSDEETFSIVVRAANSSPVLLPVSDRTLREAQIFTLELQASDADGDPLTYAVENLPPRATFDPLLGKLTWTPGLFEAGVYPDVTFTVSDGAGSSSETVTFTVDNLNQAPVLLPLPPQSGRENTPLHSASPRPISMAIPVVHRQRAVAGWGKV